MTLRARSWRRITPLRSSGVRVLEDFSGKGHSAAWHHYPGRNLASILDHDRALPRSALERCGIRPRPGFERSDRSPFLDILAGAYMVRILPPWFENLSKRQVKAPKIYVRDTGVMHALLELETLDDLLAHPKLGASWEGFALEQVLAAFGQRHAWFWATHGGAELDLLLKVRGKAHGFEFKVWTRRDRPAPCAPLCKTLASNIYGLCIREPKLTRLTNVCPCCPCEISLGCQGVLPAPKTACPDRPRPGLPWSSPLKKQPLPRTRCQENPYRKILIFLKKRERYDSSGFRARRSQAASPFARNLPAANRVSERAARDKNRQSQKLI